MLPYHDLEDTLLQRQAVCIILFHILRYPQDSRAKNVGLTARVSISMHSPQGYIEKWRDSLPHHNQRVGNNIRNSKVYRLQRIVLKNVFKNQDSLQTTILAIFPPLTRPQSNSLSVNTYHTPRQPPRQQRKAQKQHKARFPRNPIPRITKRICTQPRLLDGIDH